MQQQLVKPWEIVQLREADLFCSLAISGKTGRHKMWQKERIQSEIVLQKMEYLFRNLRTTEIEAKN
jgi:hypothetical protein